MTHAPIDPSRLLALRQGNTYSDLSAILGVPVTSIRDKIMAAEHELGVTHYRGTTAWTHRGEDTGLGGIVGSG